MHEKVNMNDKIIARNHSQEDRRKSASMHPFLSFFFWCSTDKNGDYHPSKNSLFIKISSKLFITIDPQAFLRK